MIELLCDDSTSCKEAGDNNYYHRPGQRQTFNMSVKSMRISLDHFIYCIRLYKCKTIFSICGSIFSITGPLQKLFHYAIFQKFFHIFIIH